MSRVVRDSSGKGRNIQGICDCPEVTKGGSMKKEMFETLVFHYFIHESWKHTEDYTGQYELTEGDKQKICAAVDEMYTVMSRHAGNLKEEG